MDKIIPIDRSVVPACDVSKEKYIDILKSTNNIEKVGGYKVGPVLAGRLGYDEIVKITRDHTDKPLIYDAQKWGTDIPDTAEKILTPLKESGINTVILFPQSGPVVAYEWIKTSQDLGLGVIVGGEMTHPRYLSTDLSEGNKVNYTEIFKELGIRRTMPGFMREGAPEDIYEIASRMGVTNFVVPGNKPDKITHYKSLIERCGISKPTFWSPGLVAQSGKISNGAKAAGKRFHGIVGRGLYETENIRQSALELTQEL